MRRFVKLFILALCVLLTLALIAPIVGYWTFYSISANIFSHSDASFDGSMSVTVSTEDYGRITIPYDFSGKIKNIAQRSMQFEIDSESYVDGITSYDKVYYTNGNTYISSNIWLDGIDVYTEKIRRLPIDVRILSKTHELDEIGSSLLSHWDFYSNKVNYKNGMFVVNASLDDVKGAVLDFALDRVNNSTLTATEKRVKTEKYYKLVNDYSLTDFNIAYKLVNYNTVYIELKASVTIKESASYPCDRHYEISLRLNITADSIETIDLPDDLSSYKLESQLYPN